jgi:hypothetical protein
VKIPRGRVTRNPEVTFSNSRLAWSSQKFPFGCATAGRYPTHNSEAKPLIRPLPTKELGRICAHGLLVLGYELKHGAIELFGLFPPNGVSGIRNRNELGPFDSIRDPAH